MKAVIIAGGEGSRLRPLTLGRPKPMVPLVNKPVLTHILDLLKRHGITDVVMTVHYLADRIREYYADGSNFGMNIEYSVEGAPLGTAGGVKLAQPLLDDTFLVVAGDALTDFDLTKVIESHRRSGAMATLTLTHVPNPLEYGVVQTDESGRIIRYNEKPGWSEVMSDTVNTGIYVLEPEVLDLIEPEVSTDFSHDVFRQMIDEKRNLCGHIADGYWTDIGSFEEYIRASNDILRGAVNMDPIGVDRGNGLWVEGEVDIAPDADLKGPIYLGPGVKIKGGVTIQGPCVIRDNVVIDTRANIEHSIIWRNSYIGERVEVRGAIIGLQCAVKARAMIFEGVVISDNTLINENAVIQPNVKIWPDKEIEAGATVTNSIIWGSQGKRNLFGRYGVTGMVNVDLTPEFCARVGAAFGSILPKGAKVTVNREAHNTPRVLKRAILSGLPSAGIDALDTATQPIPVVRFYTRDSDANGGIHVRLSPYDNRVVDIKFFGSTGLDLSQQEQRSIENVFFREDYRRVYLDEIGQIRYPADVVQRYHKRFIETLQSHRWPLSDRYDHVVIDYANSSSALVLPDLLNQLKCDVVAMNTLLEQGMLFRTRPEWEAAVQRLGAITQALGANFGVRLDVGGERAFFTSNDGALMNDTDALIAVATLVLRGQPGAAIGVPATAPRILEQIASKYGGSVHRLRLGQKALMEAATTLHCAMLGDAQGSFVFPQFIPFPDAMFTTVKVMELTAEAGETLSDVWRARQSYHMGRARVPCRWESKGKVMRLLRERFRQSDGNSSEGIVIEAGHGEWVLIMPDPGEPFFWVHAEAESSQAATEIADKYSSLVSAMIQE